MIISKATVRHHWSSGKARCKDSRKKTRRYCIRTDDVIFSLVMFAENLEEAERLGQEWVCLFSFCRMDAREGGKGSLSSPHFFHVVCDTRRNHCRHTRADGRNMKLQTGKKGAKETMQAPSQLRFMGRSMWSVIWIEATKEDQALLCNALQWSRADCELIDNAHSKAEVMPRIQEYAPQIIILNLDAADFAWENHPANISWLRPGAAHRKGSVFLAQKAVKIGADRLIKKPISIKTLVLPQLVQAA